MIDALKLAEDLEDEIQDAERCEPYRLSTNAREMRLLAAALRLAEADAALQVARALRDEKRSAIDLRRRMERIYIDEDWEMWDEEDDRFNGWPEQRDCIAANHVFDEHYSRTLSARAAYRAAKEGTCPHDLSGPGNSCSRCGAS